MSCTNTQSTSSAHAFRRGSLSKHIMAATLTALTSKLSQPARKPRRPPGQVRSPLRATTWFEASDRLIDH